MSVIARCHRSRHTKRQGAIATVAAFSIILVLAMVAFAIDLGYICVGRVQAQRAADAGALAAAVQLTSEDRLKGEDWWTTAWNIRQKANYYAKTNKVAAKETQVFYNVWNGVDGDIVLGRLNNPTNRNEPLDTSNFSDFNAVTVRIRRIQDRNSPIQLFFSRVLGINSANVTAEATAIFEDRIGGFKATDDTGNSSLLPFAVDILDWENLLAGNGPDDWSYDSNTGINPGWDGIPELNMFPGGGNGGGPGQNQTTPGNWGTIDIGTSGNSTSHLRDLIRHGPTPQDFSYHGGSIELDPSTGTLELGGDTGISGGMDSALAEVVGQPRTIFLYDQVTDTGNNTIFRIIGFAGIRVVDYDLTGSDKYINVQPAMVMDPTAIATDAETSYYVAQPIHLVR